MSPLGRVRRGAAPRQRMKSPEVPQLLLILAQATFFVSIASFRVAACTWIWRALACSATGTVSRSTPFS